VKTEFNATTQPPGRVASSGVYPFSPLAASTPTEQTNPPVVTEPSRLIPPEADHSSARRLP